MLSRPSKPLGQTPRETKHIIVWVESDVLIGLVWYQIMLTTGAVFAVHKLLA